MPRITKVDRVCSPDEAITLQDKGVSFIGVSMTKDIRFKDSRRVSLEEAVAIRDVLRDGVSFSVELPIAYLNGSENNPIASLDFDYIQVDAHELTYIDYMEHYQSLGDSKLVLSGIDVSYDSDPSWILSGVAQEFMRSGTIFQIDILPEISNSWEFLKTECPKFSEDLQLADLDYLASQFQILFTTDFSQENLSELSILIPNNFGIYLVLGEHSVREDVHFFSYSEVLRILDAL
ncbi:MAG: hypothetical protein HC910_14110 [Spirulinaceae cyanobacterium SM2_1_0]|nr:hypothetical protein [Spirulinaceae cyanobacterium SM2_1_0]